MKATRHISGFGTGSLFLSALAPFLGGCWDAGLPGTLDVGLPDGSIVAAVRGSAAASLANSQWAIYEDPDDPYLLFKVEFGPHGELVRLFDNRIMPETIGNELVGDGTVRPIVLAGLAYVGASYAGQNDSGLGFSAFCSVLLGPLQVGTGTFHFTGTLNGDRLEGTYGWAAEVDPMVEEWGFFASGQYEEPVVGVPVGADPPLPRGADAYERDGDPTQAKPIALGESQNHSLVPAGDEDWLVLALPAITSIMIETSGEYGDTRLWLYGADGVEIAFDDDGGTGGFSMIYADELPAGTYYIKVDEYGGDDLVASYAIDVRQTAAIDAYEPDGDSSQAKPIAVGETQIRSLHPAGDQDCLVLAINAPGSIVIETTGESGDTVLYLYDANLSGLAFDDDGGTGLFSRIQRADLPAGIYYIKVAEYGNNQSVPMYRIEVRPAD